MRKRINTDELEDYLKDVADGHTMYPSNQIWTNIRENLHGNTRWPALTFIALFIITSLIIGTVFIKPDEAILKQTAASSLAFNTTRPIVKNTFPETINPEKVTSRTIDRIRENEIVIASVNEEVIPEYKPVDKQIISSFHQLFASAKTKQFELPAEVPLFVLKENLNTEILVTENKQEENEVSPEKTENKESALIIASTTIKLPKNKVSRWEVDYYITPSSSFRRMSDDNKIKTASVYNIIPVTTNTNIDVNQVIRHRSAMGVEAGVSFGYKLTGQLKLKAGLQLNIRQYDIQAYSSATELVRLTVTNGARIDTVNALSNYRNGNGAAEITLKNKYHEISVPIGIEWSNNLSKRISWGFAATVQPTYIFNKKAYLISNDYKNYTAGAPLFRNWNLNTGLEGYISYKAGDYTWHLGPQVRYQQLSSYSNKYPIKENLYDYGVKFGFTKTIK
jgi:hypothetical protein